MQLFSRSPTRGGAHPVRKPLNNGVIHVSTMIKRPCRQPARDIEEVKFATMIAGSQPFSIG